jgi:hypothetical protein
VALSACALRKEFVIHSECTCTNVASRNENDAIHGQFFQPGTSWQAAPGPIHSGNNIEGQHAGLRSQGNLYLNKRVLLQEEIPSVKSAKVSGLRCRRL